MTNTYENATLFTTLENLHSAIIDHANESSSNRFHICFWISSDCSGGPVLTRNQVPTLTKKLLNTVKKLPAGTRYFIKNC